MPEQKNQELASIVIISIAVVAALVVLAFNNSLELQGAAVNIKHVDTVEKSCVDDDPLNNYNQPGMVQQSSVQYFDYCVGNTLFQRYCRTGGRIGVTSGYQCPNGCSEGMCR